MASEHVNTITKGNNEFTQKLYDELKTKDGNVFFSPTSVHTILSLLHQGANGESESALKSSLGIPEKSLSADAFQSVMSTLNNIADVTLEIANKVYVMHGFNLKPDFSAVAKKSFFSEAENVNFAESTKAAGLMNSWVEKKTKNKIKDLVSPGDLDSLTRLVLINAIYFKGDWADKFNASLTRTEPFYLNDNDSVDCQMMQKKRKYNYKVVNELDSRVLEIPYKNENVSLVIVLPNKRTGIADLEEKLKTYDLSTLTEGMSNIEVMLSLPKFKVETTMELNGPLKKIGLANIFTQGAADFSGLLTSPEELYVSKVIQKAFIEVNEEGAEAAAATGILRAMLASPTLRTDLIKFVADHPFIYYIKLNTREGSKLLLFTGKIVGC